MMTLRWVSASKLDGKIGPLAGILDDQCFVGTDWTR